MMLLGKKTTCRNCGHVTDEVLSAYAIYLYHMPDIDDIDWTPPAWHSFLGERLKRKRRKALTIWNFVYAKTRRVRIRSPPLVIEERSKP